MAAKRSDKGSVRRSPHRLKTVAVANADPLCYIWGTNANPIRVVRGSPPFPRAGSQHPPREGMARGEVLVLRSPMYVSLFDNSKDNLPQQVETSWFELVEQLSQHDRTSCYPCPGHKCKAKDGQGWSPVSYREDATRGLAGVENVYALVLDFDKPTVETVEALERELEGLAHVIYSTHSFNGSDNLSCRVVVPLAEPVPAKRWASVWTSTVATLGLPADPSCSDASRLFYAPSAPIGAPVFFHEGKGEPLPVPERVHTPATVPVPTRSVPTPTVDVPERVLDLDDLRAQLKRARSPGSAPLVRMLCAGEPLPDGGHDDTLNRLAWIFARYLPLSTPLEVLVELLRPTLQATECDEGYEHHVAEFTDMWARAKKARAEAVETEQRAASMVREKVKRSVGAAAAQEGFQPALMFVVPWEKWVYELDGEWQLRTPVGLRGAKRRIEDGGYILDALEQVPEDSPEADALRDTKTLERHPLVQTVYGVECAPNEPELFKSKGALTLNQWQAPTLQSEPGQFPSIQRVIDYLTMSDGVHDPKGARWLIHWMAAKVQRPGHTRLTAPVFHGTPGSGKNTLLRPFMEALGTKNCATIKQKDLESDFNAHFANKLFVFADDCVPSGSLRSLSETLKTYITGESVTINAKGVSQLEVPNRAAWLFTSNAENPIVVEKDDRRYTVFSNKLAVTDEWRSFCRSLWVTGEPNTPTEKFWREMSAFKHYLENLEVDWDFIDLPYTNSARQEIIEANLDSRDSFVREVEQVGFGNIAAQVGVYMAPEYVRPKHAETSEYSFAYVYQVYKKWAEQSGFKHPVTKRYLGMRLKNAWRRREVPSVVYSPPERSADTPPPSASERVKQALA